MRRYRGVLIAAALLTTAIIAGLAQSDNQDLVVHEWGTFTSVQGSNGVALDGMYHEDEQLPDFVHSRNATHSDPRGEVCRKAKGEPTCRRQSLEYFKITQKMETPVVYFHTKNPQAVSVTVGFPKGVISQYYPAPTSSFPVEGQLDRLANGLVTFDVDLKTESLEIPEVDPANIYAPSRAVEANYFTTPLGEAEKLIFYRGLGDFQTELVATSKGEKIILTNHGGSQIERIILVNIKDGQGALASVNPLAPGAYTDVTAKVEGLKSQMRPISEFIDEVAFGHLSKVLQDQGLNRDESESMVNTWKKSYFQNEGLRVLYVLSANETEKILPMKVTPTPREITRALVGRIEILTNNEERQILRDIKAANNANQDYDVKPLGRFADAKLHRVLELAGHGDDDVRGYIQAMIRDLRLQTN